jgi:hypothetical protein
VAALTKPDNKLCRIGFRAGALVFGHSSFDFIRPQDRERGSPCS